MSKRNRNKPPPPPPPAPAVGPYERFLGWLPPDWRAVMTHPRPFLVVTGGMAVLIFLGLEWWHQERFDDLDATIGTKNATIEGLAQTKGELEKEIVRLRVAAGIDRPDSRTALSVLTNAQLRDKTNTLVSQIRDMEGRARARTEEFERNNPISLAKTDAEKKSRHDHLHRIINEEAQKIDRAIGTESIVLVNELHRRIPEAQREHILGAGLDLRLDNPHNEGQTARLLFLGSSGGPMSLFAMSQLLILANELDALSKLLPPD